MGFSNLDSDAGIAVLDDWVKTRSYIVDFAPSQADVVVFKAVGTAPDPAKFVHAARWYKHIAALKDQFDSLRGDASTPPSKYGPADSEIPLHPTKAPVEDDEDVDLFGSDEEEDPETVRIREERLAEYKKKKEGKAKPVAKSIVTLDVKPWDDETDLEEMLTNIKAIEIPGLVWSSHKFIPIGFGIKKLQINLVVEDSVSIDELQERIQEDEDHVQSTDIAAMQKL